MKTAYIVNHTHWDREWRYPIWKTRLMLLEFMDELIEMMEQGIYPGFLMDGQVSPVLDYLEMRPEMRERVVALVEAGKLEIGPWYTLPDEFPVDGEAMVRNLLWGHREARKLGGVFSTGYTPFGWGQTAQLVQMYTGFGMDVGMIGKYVNKERAPKSEFVWRGPDGSELLCTRFGGMGRQNFYFYFHLNALHAKHYLNNDEWQYLYKEGGLLCHDATPKGMEQDFERLDAPASWHPERVTPEMLDECWSSTDESVMPDDRLMMNGCDYTAAQPMFQEMLEKLRATDPDPDREWRHATMTEFVGVMREKIDRATLPVVEGELRDGPSMLHTGNALATRLYIKRRNKEAQNLLIRFAEPLCALAAMLGAEYPKRFLDKAWQKLLLSHPHDSINGVTQDATANDVMARLQEVIGLADAMGQKAMREILHRLDTSTCGAVDDVLLVAFNPLPYSRRETLEAWICTPDDECLHRLWPAAANELQIFEIDGTPLSTQWEGRQQHTYPVEESHTRAFPFDTQRHRVFFDSGEIPAGGCKVYRIGSLKGTSVPGVDWSDALAETGNLRTAPNVLENRHLRLVMHPNGTFDLEAKALGHTFRGLNYYEDRGEQGEYWINSRPMFDQIHTSQGCSARIWCEESGPLRATFVSEIEWMLPRRGNRHTKDRGTELAPMRITTRVTLTRDSEQVDVQVDFENRHEDHYLRAMFPTGLSGATHADVGGHFTVDHRPVRPCGPSAGSYWPDMGTLPQHSFVDLSDGKRGIAFLNDSLTEYEVLENEERTVALSLLRATHNWICTETRVGSIYPSQKGGQCLGPHSIRYALRPHAGRWQSANTPLAAEQFNVPVRLLQSRAWKPEAPSVAPGALFEIENPALRFSALKPAEDGGGWVLRIFNPTPEKQAGGIRFFRKLIAAQACNLDEVRQESLTIRDDRVIEISCAPGKIRTIHFEMAKGDV